MEGCGFGICLVVVGMVFILQLGVVFYYLYCKYQYIYKKFCIVIDFILFGVFEELVVIIVLCYYIENCFMVFLNMYDYIFSID